MAEGGSGPRTRTWWRERWSPPLLSDDESQDVPETSTTRQETSDFPSQESSARVPFVDQSELVVSGRRRQQWSRGPPALNTRKRHASGPSGPSRASSPCHKRSTAEQSKHRLKRKCRGRINAKPYANIVGNHRDKYLPIKKNSMHGKGLCVIIVNDEGRIPNVLEDIIGLEEFYSNTLWYTVSGGVNDPEKEYYRDIKDGDLFKIVSKINTQFDPNIILRGTEYDRIIIHFFGLGNAEVMQMHGGSELCKVKLLQLIASKIPNLAKHIPLVVCLHSYADPNQQANPEHQAFPASHVEIAQNVLGIFSGSHGETRRGSWIIQEFLFQLSRHHAHLSFLEMIWKVNEMARPDRSQPEFVVVQNDFKNLYLTMGEEFHQSLPEVESS